jgi:hypothetical protein
MKTTTNKYGLSAWIDRIYCCFWLYRGWIQSWLEWRPTLGEIFEWAIDLGRWLFRNLIWTVQALGDLICDNLFLPVAASVVSLLTACKYCVTDTLPSLFYSGTVFFIVVVASALLVKHTQPILKIYVPNVVGTVYFIITYRPVLVAVLTTLLLHPPTQDLIVDYLGSLKSNPWWFAFLFLFWWKAVKIIVHTYSYVFLTEANLYRPVPNPTFFSKDVTVIIPSVGSFGKEFRKTVQSILENAPGQTSMFLVSFSSHFPPSPQTFGLLSRLLHFEEAKPPQTSSLFPCLSDTS